MKMKVGALGSGSWAKAEKGKGKKWGVQRRPCGGRREGEGDRRPAVHGHGGDGWRLGRVSRGVGRRQVGPEATVPSGGEIPISNFEI
jgi:hypothetical protein